MAYRFSGAYGDSITASAVPVTAPPMTLFCRSNTTDDNGYPGMVNIRNSANNSRFFITGNLTGSTTNLIAQTWGGTAADATRSGISPGTWQAMTGVFAGTASRTAYVDATAGTTNTADRIPTSLTILQIGDPTQTEAEVAIWNAALSADEIASLSKGFKPTRIRPQSLVFYAPLIRNLQDLRGGLALTNVNSSTVTVADHPRVY